MDKVLMLGAGHCQTNAIRRLESEMGVAVVAADYYPHAPGKRLSTWRSNASTFDVGACLAAARRYGVRAVMTTGTDQPVYTAAAVSEALGLRFFFSAEKGLEVTDKRRMKEIMSRSGIPTVPHAFIGEGFDDGEAAGLKPPYVLKPLDSQGQRGVFKLETLAAVRRALPETLGFSRQKQALLESHYPNTELTVSGWVHKGHPVILTVTDRLVMERGRHLGICVAHQFPSRHMADKREEIEGLCGRLVEAFGLREGPFYFQMLAGKKGLLVNEIACRIGGAYEDQFIPVLTGVDILKLQTDYLLDRPMDLAPLLVHDAWRVNRHFSAQLFFADRGTVVFRTPLEEILALPGVFGAGYHVGIGDAIGAVENATARAGYFLTEAESPEALEKAVRKVYEHLRILDFSGANLVVPGPVVLDGREVAP